VEKLIGELTFRKIASPLGTSTNISPPTCSTPRSELRKRKKKNIYNVLTVN